MAQAFKQFKPFWVRTGLARDSDRIEYLVDGKAFFTRFIDAISAAEESIHIRMYIFDNDDYATRIGELLKRRSNQDIEIKIMLDGIGTLTAALEDPDSLPADHQPPASVVRFLESGSQINVRQLSNPFLTGDHTKTITIDCRRGRPAASSWTSSARTAAPCRHGP